MTTASACGKAILLGEHAVVYGQPAIAVPVSDVRATATVASLPPGSGIRLVAESLGAEFFLDDIHEDEMALPLQVTVRNTLRHCGLDGDRAMRITVSSCIPIARGLGSGTAVATAVVRSVALHYGQPLDASTVSRLVFQTEVLYHGTPSGVDNAVVAYEKPIYFVRGEEPMVFPVGAPLTLLIGDTGKPSRTRDTVGAVRGLYGQERASCEGLFAEIGDLVREGRCAIGAGDSEELGRLMDRNQELLEALQVSTPELDCLVVAARSAGALGAKLSGGGGGGCMIALATGESRGQVAEALLVAGAAQVLSTIVC